MRLKDKENKESLMRRYEDNLDIKINYHNKKYIEINIDNIRSISI